MVMLGALAGNTEILPFSQEDLKSAIKAQVPSKYYEVNIAAFKKGLEYKILN